MAIQIQENTMTSSLKLTPKEKQALYLAVKNGDVLAVKAIWNPSFKADIPLDYSHNTLAHLCVLHHQPEVFQWFIQKYPHAASGCLNTQANITLFETALLLEPAAHPHKEEWVHRFLNHPDFLPRFDSFQRAMLPGVESKYAALLVQACRKKGLDFEIDFFTTATDRSRPDVLQWLLANAIHPLSELPLKNLLETALDHPALNIGLFRLGDIEDRRAQTVELWRSTIAQVHLQSILPEPTTPTTKPGRL